jgi:hypothetical protein
VRPRLLLSLVLLGASLARPTPALAAPAAADAIDEQAEFEKGRNAYRAQKYEEADTRFLRMLDPEHGTLHDRVLIKQARMYWAATRLALHHEDDASGQFEIILTEDPQYSPDPLAFPTEVGNAFIDFRSRYSLKLAEIAKDRYRRAEERKAQEEAAKQREAARLKLLETMAGQVEVTEKHSRWVALLPFGVGQFQNGQRRLGWFFLGSESVLVAAGIATIPIYYVDLSNSHDTYSQNHTIAQEYLDRANAVRIVNLSVYAALAATVIAGAIQGEAAYVPDPVTVVPRAVPSALPPATPAARVSPPWTFGASPLAGREGKGVSGGTVNVGLRF